MKRLITLLLLIPALAFGANDVKETAASVKAYRATVLKKSGFAGVAECKAWLATQAVAATWRCVDERKIAVSKAAVTPVDPTPVPTSWVQCAVEGATCAFTGTQAVKYGGRLAGQQSIIKTLAGPVKCEDATFGAPPSSYENVCSIGGAADPTPVTPTPITPAPVTGKGPRVSSFTPSGPIVAQTGQVIAGVSISNPGGNCITIPSGVTGVVVRDSAIGPCGGDASIVVQGNGATIEYTLVKQGKRGVLINRASGATLRASIISGPFSGNSCGSTNPDHCSGAVQLDNANGATIDGNSIQGENFGSDALSGYESSGMRFTNNVIDVGIKWQHAAPFTMGDSTTGNPGRDNYVAGNIVRQRGGVPPGVFGAGGNTIFERNCLTTGLQAYNYSGIFTGVTIRKNVIGPGSYVPDTSILAEWSTNILGSTDCSRVPQ